MNAGERRRAAAAGADAAEQVRGAMARIGDRLASLAGETPAGVEPEAADRLQAVESIRRDLRTAHRMIGELKARVSEYAGEA